MKPENVISYKLVRSSRKTIGITVGSDGTVTVRAPYLVSASVIDRFVNEKADWIISHQKKAEKAASLSNQAEKLTEAELRALAVKAKEIIPARVAFYAKKVGVTYGKITIRNQKTRWGSCSAKGNLNFNCLLMLVPSEVLDAVIVHELCHRREMNHSERFYALVLKVMPDYRERFRYLKEHGRELMARLP